MTAKSFRDLGVVEVVVDLVVGIAVAVLVDRTEMVDVGWVRSEKVLFWLVAIMSNQIVEMALAEMSSADTPVEVVLLADDPESLGKLL